VFVLICLLEDKKLRDMFGSPFIPLFGGMLSRSLFLLACSSTEFFKLYVFTTYILIY
jgi:hypothetical protein